MNERDRVSQGRHSLEAILAGARRRAQGTVTRRALSQVATVALVSITLAGVLDFWRRPIDPGLRLFLSLAPLVATLWAGWRWLWPCLKRRAGDVEFALRLEDHFPELSDRLASAVQFLKGDEDDPLAGSPALRRSAVSRVTADIERLDLARVVVTAPATRAIAIAVFVAALVGAAVIAHPALAKVGWSRLVRPLGDDLWPRKNHLDFAEPIERLGLGQTFEVEIVDVEGARLPDDVAILFRHDGGEGSETRETPTWLDGKLLFRRENVTRPFVYGVVGGDDLSIEWRPLEIIEPPVVESLRTKIDYPDYTGWPDGQGEDRVRAIRGSRVEISARVSKPLGAALLRFEGGRGLPAKVDEDGLGFTVPGPAPSEATWPAHSPIDFVVEKSGAFAFELMDRQGYSGGADTRYEIVAIEDRPPTVTFERPKANLRVTPEAIVPLAIQAQDDLALRNIELRVSNVANPGSNETIVPLFAGSIAPPSRGSPAGDFGEPDEKKIEFDWRPETLGLKPGAQVDLVAAAFDYRPEEGKSSPRRLTVVTPDEMRDFLAERQETALDELARIVSLAREGRSQVAALKNKEIEQGDLGQADLDRMRTAELTSRQVDRGLSGEPDGVASQIDSILADTRSNHLDSPDVIRRLSETRAEIERLSRGPLAEATRELSAAIKITRGRLENSPDDRSEKSSPATSLAAAEERQTETIEALERQLGELAQWDTYRRVHREISRTRKEQEELVRDTEAWAKRSLENSEHNAAEEAAHAKTQSDRQRELARNFDKAQERLQGIAKQLRDADPLAAEAAADAARFGEEAAIGGLMREAGGQLAGRRLAQAAKSQRRVLDQLAEMLDVLSNRKEYELSHLVKKLREAEAQLAGYKDEEGGLKKKLAAAEKIPDEEQKRKELERLSRQQLENEEAVSRLARRLKRLQAEQAESSLAKAGASMKAAGDQASSGDPASAADSAAGAEEDLARAQAELAEDRSRAEQDLADEQLARLEDGLGIMRDTQTKILADTVEYENRRARAGEWTRAEMVTVRDLGRRERFLADEADETAKKLAASRAFALAMDNVSRDMSRGATGLEERDTGAPTQGAEKSALDRLQALLDALGKDDGPQSPADESSAPPEGDSQQQAQPGENQSLAELKLLKAMQENVNARTRELDAAAQASENATGERRDDSRRELADLAAEQGRLADLLFDMAGEGAEATPDTESNSLTPEPSLDERLLDELKSQTQPEGSEPPKSRAPSAEETDDGVSGGATRAEESGIENDPPPSPDKEAKPSKLDDELLKELGEGEDLGATGQEDPLGQISEQMKESETLLGQAKTGEETRRLQTSIVDSLAKLIENARKNQKQGQGKSGQGGKRRPGGEKSRSDSGSGGQDSEGTSPGVASAKESSNDLREMKAQKGRGRSREDLLKDVWGNLPDKKLRERMRQSANDEFLPEYEIWIEQYFESLLKGSEERER